MENWGNWKLIKAGFWLGIGFIIPTFAVMAIGTVVTMTAISYVFDSAFDAEDGGIGSVLTDDSEIAEHLAIQNQREEKNGDQLLILGSIINNGEQKASSIQLEAELTDRDGSFIYECSEYINKDLKPGETENFQIKCSCGSNPTPKFEKVTVRVVSASQY